MAIIKFGTHQSRALARRSSSAPTAISYREVPSAKKDTAMGDVVEVGGDFTRGVGQGLGIVLGLVGAGWIATKMLR